MKKLLTICMLAGLIIAFQACGGGNDPKSVMGEYLTIMDGYIENMEKAESAEQVAAAMNECAERMEAIIPRMKAMMEAHPELKTMRGENLPDEFSEFSERIKAMGPRMMGLMGKLMQYGNDPVVKEANRKFQEAMSSLKN